MMLLAKPVAGGLPLGVLIAGVHISDLWEKATHATTFGGNPLVTAAGLATLEAIQKEKLLLNVRTQARYLRKRLEALQKRFPMIREVRGLGLMLGLELDRPGLGLVREAALRGLLINCTQEKVLRMYPALNVTRREIDRGLEILEASLEKQ